MTILLALTLTQDAAREDAVRKLSNQKVTVDFAGVKLSEALDFLRDATGLNLVLLPSAAVKDADQPVRLKAKDLSAKSVLKLLLHGRGLTVAWRDGALAIVPAEEVQEDVALKIYDVRSHLLKLPDFPGPRMELATSTAGSIAAGITVTLDEPKVILDPDFLVDLVRSNTGGRSWENGKATIDLVNGRLVVNQSAAAHREIDDLLRRLGQYR
ncbi:MAG TPA: hypothetical protein VF950_02315 [Planctomycetota bacterium]